MKVLVNELLIVCPVFLGGGMGYTDRARVRVRVRSSAADKDMMIAKDTDRARPLHTTRNYATEFTQLYIYISIIICHHPWLSVHVLTLTLVLNMTLNVNLTIPKTLTIIHVYP